MNELKVLAPTGILGYGFPVASLEEGMRRRPDVIAVDGGSTDGGPYYLGFEPAISAGSQSSSFKETLSRDLEPLMLAARGADVPLIIGSAGFAGADLHLMGVLTIVHEIAAQHGLGFKLATIRAEIDKGYVRRKLAEGAVEPLGAAPPLTEAAVDGCVRIVGQMGSAPFVEALEGGAQVIVAGRANDPCVFAAMALHRGFDPGLAMHMAKILECGAIAAEPGSGSDALLGTLREDCFLLEPLNPDRRCTVRSVAAHSLYEKSDPFHLYSPEGHVALHDTHFEQLDPRTVKVTGSRWVPTERPRIKLEGATRVGFRTISVSGIRDPTAIANLDALLEAARDHASTRFSEIAAGTARLNFMVYGRDGVMGALEPRRGSPGHEVGLVIEVVAETQSMATTMCGHVRSWLLHCGFPGRLSTAGNLAFPFSPLDIPAGPVYRFDVYHLVDEPDPAHLFPVSINTL